MSQTSIFDLGPERLNQLLSLGKENLRYGREALARCRDDVNYLVQARRHLRRSLAANLWSRRAWIYLIWSYVAPTTYGGWRRRERRALAPRGR